MSSTRNYTSGTRLIADPPTTPAPTAVLVPAPPQRIHLPLVIK